MREGLEELALGWCEKGAQKNFDQHRPDTGKNLGATDDRGGVACSLSGLL